MQKYLFGLSEDRHQVPSLVGKYYNSSCQKVSQVFARKFQTRKFYLPLRRWSGWTGCRQCLNCLCGLFGQSWNCFFIYLFVCFLFVCYRQALKKDIMLIVPVQGRGTFMCDHWIATGLQPVSCIVWLFACKSICFQILYSELKNSFSVYACRYICRGLFKIYLFVCFFRYLWM